MFNLVYGDNMSNVKMMQFLQPATVTREDLARSVRRYTRLSMKEAAMLVDQIIDSMSDAVLADKMVKIRLFGIFSTRQKKERMGRNPKTMVEAVIAARKVLKFKPAPTLKKRINANIEGISLCRQT